MTSNNESPMHKITFAIAQGNFGVPVGTSEDRDAHQEARLIGNEIHMTTTRKNVTEPYKSRKDVTVFNIEDDGGIILHQSRKIYDVNDFLLATFEYAQAKDSPDVTITQTLFNGASSEKTMPREKLVFSEAHVLEIVRAFHDAIKTEMNKGQERI